MEQQEILGYPLFWNDFNPTFSTPNKPSLARFRSSITPSSSRSMEQFTSQSILKIVPPMLIDEEDEKLCQILPEMCPRSIKESPDIQKLIVGLVQKQSVSFGQVAVLIVAIVGLVLNATLLFVMFVAGSNLASFRLRNQRFFITLNASAYSFYCLYIIVEFVALQIDTTGFAISCMTLFRDRCVKNLAQFLIIGSVLGCAADNYLAVCKPIFHRLHSAKINVYFSMALLCYIMAAIFLTFSDFIVPFDFDKNCSNSPGLDDMRGVYMGIFRISSTSVSFKDYCRAIEDCLNNTWIMEISVLVVWATTALPVSFFYIKTAVVLRNSLNNLFPVETTATPRNSSGLLFSAAGTATSTVAVRPTTFAKRRRYASQDYSQDNGSFRSNLRSSIARRFSHTQRRASFDSSFIEQSPISPASMPDHLSLSLLHSPLGAKSSVGLSSIMEHCGPDEAGSNEQLQRKASFRLKVTSESDGDEAAVVVAEEPTTGEDEVLNSPLAKVTPNKSSFLRVPKNSDGDEWCETPPSSRSSSASSCSLEAAEQDGHSSIIIPVPPNVNRNPMKPPSVTNSSSFIRRSSPTPLTETRSNNRSFASPMRASIRRISLLSSNGSTSNFNGDRRVSVSQAQTLNLLRNRRRSS